MDEQLMWDAEMAANKLEMLEAEFQAMLEYEAHSSSKKEIDWSITTAHDESGDWDYSYRDWA